MTGPQLIPAVLPYQCRRTTPTRRSGGRPYCSHCLYTCTFTPLGTFCHRGGLQPLLPPHRKGTSPPYVVLNQARGRGLGGDEPPEHLEGGGRAAAARRDARAHAARHRRRTLFGAGPSSAWGLSGARPPLSAPGLCRPRGALHRCQSAVRETVIKLRIHDAATFCSSWLPLLSAHLCVSRVLSVRFSPLPWMRRRAWIHALVRTAALEVRPTNRITRLPCVPLSSAP